MYKIKGIDRFELPFKAVHLKSLKEDGTPHAVASGFIFREVDGLYLYTCWHVVTGYDPDDLKVLVPPKQKALEMHFQGMEQRAPGMSVTGGHQSICLDLYDNTTSPPTPRWLQSNLHIPHGDLNDINIRVPFWGDLVKLKLPTDLNVSHLQVIDQSSVNQGVFPGVGEKMFIVGFPYGYSAMSMDQPTAVVLTRFLAANTVNKKVCAALLDGIGAAGMSGCPVFIERNERSFLAGIYTGSIFPDHVIKQNNPVTAMGKMCHLTFFLQEGRPFPLVEHNDERVRQAT